MSQISSLGFSFYLMSRIGKHSVKKKLNLFLNDIKWELGLQ